MIEAKTRTRKQQNNELTNQRSRSDRFIDAPEKEQTREAQKQAIIDRINQNKIRYRTELERQKEENQRLKTELKPEMEHVEALQEEKQANPERRFDGAKATQQYRQGKVAADIERARKKHAFHMRDEDANERILKAANNPHQKKEDDLDKQLTQQERDMRRVFRDPNIPPHKKIEFFISQIQGVKDAPLTDRQAIEKRGKRLIKETKPKQKKVLKKQLNRLVANSAGR
ncbi:MAG: hypothetical protein E7013_04000 [Alphaproteobacteria bacterium]|nr:hypothetical protein [Alphaproteobacteria bacterium]